MPINPIDYVRVTDEVKPRREYSIVRSAYDPEIHQLLDKPATESDGTPLPPKYAPESLSSPVEPATTQSGQKAEPKKES